MGLAAGGEALDLRGEAELIGQGAEAVLAADELEVAGQPRGVHQPGGGDRGVAAVQQPPVHPDIVPDQDAPIDAAGQLGPDLSWEGGAGEAVLVRPGEIQGRRWMARPG